MDFNKSYWFFAEGALYRHVILCSGVSCMVGHIMYKGKSHRQITDQIMVMYLNYNFDDAEDSA